MTPHEQSAPGGRAPLAGHQVARIGYGAMQLERAGDPERARSVLRAAVDFGVDHIDTAAFYGDCNAWIARALRRGDGTYPDGLVLATKVGARRAADGVLVGAQTPAELRADVEANLRSLRVQRLGVVYLRRIDAPPGLVAEGDQIVDLDSQLEELTAMRDEGLIEGIGLSAVTAEQLRAALPARIAAVQNMYGVLERTHEPLRERCRAEGIAWVPFFPLGSAFPDHANASDDPTIRAIAAELHATAAQVALAWLLHDHDDTLLIPGTANVDHLRENLAVGDLELPADAVARLDALADPASAAVREGRPSG